MHSTGLLHQIAYEDPEGWDGGVTDTKITKLHEELFGAVVMDSEEPWIGVDLDGTLAHYDEWRGIEHIGEPITPMWRRVMEWLREGKQVRILTARVGPQRHDVPHSVAEITGHIEQWCLKHLGQVLPVTCQKDYNMVEFWDDRCVQVVANEGISLAEQFSNGLPTPQVDQSYNFAHECHRESKVVPYEVAQILEVQLAKAREAVAELNQRLIERQESYTAQVVRIEGTWRERLRVKVGLVWQEPGENSPATTGKYLVELHDGTHEMVRVEETFEEYEDGTPADRSEWRAWAEVPGSGKAAVILDAEKVSCDNPPKT